MKVYVLTIGYDYGGERVLGVFAGVALAWKAAIAEMRSQGHDEYIPDELPTKAGCIESGSSTFYITEWEVSQ